MRWAGHVILMGEIKNACRIVVEILKERDCFEGLGMEMKIIL
jgi:hypothetical protein